MDCLTTKGFPNQKLSLILSTIKVHDPTLRLTKMSHDTCQLVHNKML